MNHVLFDTSTIQYDSAQPPKLNSYCYIYNVSLYNCIIKSIESVPRSTNCQSKPQLDQLSNLTSAVTILSNILHYLSCLTQSSISSGFHANVNQFESANPMFVALGHQDSRYIFQFCDTLACLTQTSGQNFCLPFFYYFDIQKEQKNLY